ncbi:hypothetical protein AL537_14140 [Vibrio diabolicus]|nr:hypothetical protein AL537_14140 [Vibrio diabolicus]
MIRHAWHFYCALVLVIMVVCGSIGCCVPHTLIGRYAYRRNRKLWNLKILK